MPNFSLYVLLLWAAAALVSATAVSSNFLIFDPPTITIENVFAYTNFKVKMASAPAGSATVNFQVDGLALSVCSLTFNSVDYGVFKQVQILPNPSLGGNGDAKSNTINIKASVCASGSVFDQATQVVVCSVKNRK